MAFSIALSGLQAATKDLKTTGNNIANAETTGFKASRAEFVDVYASTFGSTTGSVTGSGVMTSNIRQIFNQGNLDVTGVNTDLAIDGAGFFIVKDDNGRYLTRNGSFGRDKDDNIVNSTGQTLQVYPAVKNGESVTFNTATLTDLQLKNAIGSPVATTNVNVNVNVDAQSTSFNLAGGTTANPLYDYTAGDIPFNSDDPTTYNYVTSTTSYDSLGAEHVTQMFFRKVDDGSGAANTWQVITRIDGNDVSPSSTGVAGGAALSAPPVTGQAALFEFNVDGTLNRISYDGQPVNEMNLSMGYATVPTSSGAANIDININFAAVTQYGSEFSVNELSQNGFTTGRLTGFDVEDDGIVYARFTNGNSEVLGMLALGNVPNTQGLQQKGSSLWVESFAAGDMTLGQPGTGDLGIIRAGALESSTSELSDELVNMIVSQRNYQANAQMISTVDQLTQTLLNIR